MKAISTIATYLHWLDEIEEPPPMMFRGQAANWPLLPSITRMARIDRVLAGYDSWQVLQLDIVERFAKYARPLMDREPTDIEEWLVHAQHHGAPTRLLDWSRNPLKALFWAVEDPHLDSEDGVVWALSPRHWRDDALKPTTLDDDQITVYFPKLLNARLIAQEGCFVAFPLPHDRSPIAPLNDRAAYRADVEAIRSVKVPKRMKARLRAELRLLGVTHRFIFPDLPGIAATLRAEYEW